MTHADLILDISIKEQQLVVLENNNVVKIYPVSTAKNGPGEQKNSGCTPRGRHKIRARIGEGRPLYSVFTGRRPTGEIYSKEMRHQFPDRDWILTRILWLGGLEPGVNRYGNVDTAWRFIYIHGCPDELMKGKPESHGCIRMYNKDILDLFDRVSVNTEVYIHE